MASLENLLVAKCKPIEKAKTQRRAWREAGEGISLDCLE
jgi:hypothetical protein